MKTTKELTYNALFIALIIIMAVIPQLGIIQVGVLSITILHIPIIIAALVLGLKSSVLVSFVFGVSTLFVAMTRGASPFDLLFLNPLVSVLPRVLFGFIAGWLAQYFRKKKTNFTLGATITAVLSTLAHSIMVLSAMAIALSVQGIYDEAIFGPIGAFFVGLFTANAFFEVGVAIVIAVPVSAALVRFTRGKL